MKATLLLVAVAAIVIVNAMPEDRTVLCPVTGDPVLISPNATTLTFVGGQSIYYCCPKCFYKFVKGPNQFALPTPGPVPQFYKGQKFLCPVTQEAFVVDDYTARVQFQNGQTIFFCCEDCVGKFVANIDQYILQQ